MADQIIARVRGAQHHPKGWSRWSDAVRAGRQPADAGFKCGNVALNRFAARFRLASAFQTAQFADYGADTAAAYSALLRLVLTWGAFEAFLRVVGDRQESCDRWLASHMRRDILAILRGQDPRNTLFSAVVVGLRGQNRKEVEAYLSGAAINYTYLVSGLRHYFAHGELTPHIGGCPPALTQGVAEALTRELLAGMNGEFARRVATLSAPGA